jgi:hypothetical protein
MPLTNPRFTSNRPITHVMRGKLGRVTRKPDRAIEPRPHFDSMSALACCQSLKIHGKVSGYCSSWKLNAVLLTTLRGVANAEAGDTCGLTILSGWMAAPVVTWQGG